MTLADFLVQTTSTALGALAGYFGARSVDSRAARRAEVDRSNEHVQQLESALSIVRAAIVEHQKTATEIAAALRLSELHLAPLLDDSGWQECRALLSRSFRDVAIQSRLASFFAQSRALAALADAYQEACFLDTPSSVRLRPHLARLLSARADELNKEAHGALSAVATLRAVATSQVLTTPD